MMIADWSPGVTWSAAVPLANLADLTFVEFFIRQLCSAARVRCCASRETETSSYLHLHLGLLERASSVVQLRITSTPWSKQQILVVLTHTYSTRLISHTLTHVSLSRAAASCFFILLCACFFSSLSCVRFDRMFLSGESRSGPRERSGRKWPTRSSSTRTRTPVAWLRCLR